MEKILITGGTGSFGNTMVRRLLNDDKTKEIVVFSRDELKQHEMNNRYDSDKLSFFVGDVRDRDALGRAMKDVDVIFHAAALKQVPTGEFFPSELIRTNILGTENVVAAAEASESVKKVVLLSTDKAVYPINTMGMTKAIAEKLITSKEVSKNKTIFCAVRYGNVMMSRGSVIPVFASFLKEGKKLPVTDPKMTRFLLSLDEAIELVLLAIEKGEQGDLFVKKAPAATVEDIAQAMINIFESKQGFEVIGTREGEKIHETLASGFELLRAEDLGAHYRVASQARFSEADYLEKGVSRAMPDDYTSENTQRLSLQETQEALLALDSFQALLK